MKSAGVFYYHSHSTPIIIVYYKRSRKHNLCLSLMPFDSHWGVITVHVDRSALSTAMFRLCCDSDRAEAAIETQCNEFACVHNF